MKVVASTLLNSAGTPYGTGGGGSGTVTSVSVVTANGVSATVTTQNTTPALTFSLGAISPTSVNTPTINSTSGSVGIQYNGITRIRTTMFGAQIDGNLDMPGNSPYINLLDANTSTNDYTVSVRAGNSDGSLFSSFGWDLGNFKATVDAGKTYSFIIDQTDVLYFNGSGATITGTLFVSGITSFFERIQTSASTASRAGISVPHGVAPVVPANGEFWSTTTGFYGRVNGTTVGPFISSVSNGDKGDITVSGTGNTWAIDTGAVTFAKMQTVPTASFLGRTTAATGAVESLTTAQATALIDPATTSLKGAMSAADKSKLDALISSVATNTLMGRSTAGTGAPEVITVGSGLTLSAGTLSASGGGGGGYTVTTQAGGYAVTATSGELIVLLTGTVNQAITTPTAVGNTGKITFKKMNAGGIVTIDAFASESIDGALTAKLTRQYESITLISNNVNWSII